jgi:hypothetical protein
MDWGDDLVHVQIVSDEKLYGDPMFYEILVDMAELHSRKNRDYSPGDEPLKNFYECEDLGVPGWKGVLVRLSDKWMRIKNLVRRGGAAQNESLEDSLLDSAVYYVICLVLRRRDAEKSNGKQLDLDFGPVCNWDWVRAEHSAEYEEGKLRGAGGSGSDPGHGDGVLSGGKGEQGSAPEVQCTVGAGADLGERLQQGSVAVSRIDSWVGSSQSLDRIFVPVSDGRGGYDARRA